MNLKKCVKKLELKNLTMFIDMTKNKNEGKYRIVIERKNTFIDCICQSEAFWFFKCCFQLKTDKN